MLYREKKENKHFKLMILILILLLTSKPCIQAAASQLAAEDEQESHIGTVITKNEIDVMQTQKVSGMKLVFIIDGKDITAYYTGALVDNRPFGEGIYEFVDTHGTWKYVGTLENSGFANGTMTDYPYTMTFTDDQCYSKYSGSFYNSQPFGVGVYTIITYGNTAILEGHYDPQKGFSGYASQLSMSFIYNGVSFAGFYTGEYLNGQPNGNGSFACEGDLYFYYDGTWDDGRLNGPGQLHTNNAQMKFNGALTTAEYNGNIENGCFNGEGSISISLEDGTSYVYSGNWLNNVYSGNGTLSVSSAGSIGYTYDGSWKQGVYDGNGSLIYDSGDIIKYIGNFEKGNFRPTFTQLIASMCSAENSKVELVDYVIQYIDQYETEFINHSTTNVDCRSDFSYEAYAKAQNEENSHCFAIAIKILQKKEYDTDVFGYPVTEFIGHDSDLRMYYGYYIGHFIGIKSGDIANIIAYPIGYSSYKSQDDNDIPSLRFLAFKVV